MSVDPKFLATRTLTEASSAASKIGFVTVPSITITVGLFPKSSPPPECEVWEVNKALLVAGWNVCYAGYPPMLIQDERFETVWSKLRPYTPSVEYLPKGNIIQINPKKSVEIPFIVRF